MLWYLNSLEAFKTTGLNFLYLILHLFTQSRILILVIYWLSAITWKQLQNINAGAFYMCCVIYVQCCHSKNYDSVCSEAFEAYLATFPWTCTILGMKADEKTLAKEFFVFSKPYLSKSTDTLQ